MAKIQASQTEYWQEKFKAILGKIVHHNQMGLI